MLCSVMLYFSMLSYVYTRTHCTRTNHFHCVYTLRCLPFSFFLFFDSWLFYLYHCFWFDKRSSDFGLCFAFAAPVCSSQCSNISSHTVFNVSSKRHNHTTKHEERRMESLRFNCRREYVETRRTEPIVHCIPIPMFYGFIIFASPIYFRELEVFLFHFSFLFLQLHLPLSHFIQHSFV